MAKSDNAIGCVVQAALAIGLVRLVYVSLNVRFFAFLAAIVGLLAAGAAIYYLAKAVARIKTWWSNRRFCSHGVRGGEIGKCYVCTEERLKTSRIVAEAEAKRQESSRLFAASGELHDQEIEALRMQSLVFPSTYYELDPQRFEDAIADLFRRLGYTVTQTPYSNDRGKDAIAWKDGEKVLIECKRYGENRKIGRRDLQVFVAAMKEEGAGSGFYINTGSFAATARTYASSNGITLVDRETFPELLKKAFPDRKEDLRIKTMCLFCGDIVSLPVMDSPQEGLCANGHRVLSYVTLALLNATVLAKPVCDRCGARMKICRSRKRPDARQFWGCSRYPRCRARKRIDKYNPVPPTSS